MLRIKTTHLTTESSPGINLTPMLDVVFLILIFFLLTSVISVKPVLDLNLPQAGSARSVPDKQELQIVIYKNGNLELEGETVSLSNLEKRLRENTTQAPGKSLRVSADEAAPFGKFIKVLDIVQKLKLDHLEIVTHPPEEKP